jgi:hypothetical protein
VRWVEYALRLVFAAMSLTSWFFGNKPEGLKTAIINTTQPYKAGAHFSNEVMTWGMSVKIIAPSTAPNGVSPPTTRNNKMSVVR